jgi:hypothetical protein
VGGFRGEEDVACGSYDLEFEDLLGAEAVLVRVWAVATVEFSTEGGGIDVALRTRPGAIHLLHLLCLQLR